MQYFFLHTHKLQSKCNKKNRNENEMQRGMKTLRNLQHLYFCLIVVENLHHKLQSKSYKKEKKRKWDAERDEDILWKMRCIPICSTYILLNNDWLVNRNSFCIYSLFSKFSFSGNGNIWLNTQIGEKPFLESSHESWRGLGWKFSSFNIDYLSLLKLKNNRYCILISHYIFELCFVCTVMTNTHKSETNFLLYKYICSAT